MNYDDHWKCRQFRWMKCKKWFSEVSMGLVAIMHGEGPLIEESHGNYGLCTEHSCRDERSKGKRRKERQRKEGNGKQRKARQSNENQGKEKQSKEHRAE